jgi:hypothetical protein
MGNLLLLFGMLNACEQFSIRPHSYSKLHIINGMDFTDYSLCQKKLRMFNRAQLRTAVQITARCYVLQQERDEIHVLEALRFYLTTAARRSTVASYWS